MTLAGAKFGLFILVWCLLLGQTCLAKNATPPSIYELDQWHPNWGRLKIYIGQDRVRIVPEQYHFEVMSKGPDWQIYAFNKIDKTICTIPFSQWERTGARVTLSGLLTTIPKDYRCQNRQILGHQCIHYQGGNDSFDYVRDLACSTRVYAVVNGFYQTYAAEGVIFASERDQPAICRLKTEAIKQTHLTSNAFDAPKNYKQVDSPQLVMLTSTKKKEFEDIIDQLGVGTSFNEKRH
jgi:hypothetical protein